MTARAIDEPHRASSQLELLFDLTFVVAVAALTSRFAHAIADGHALDALVPFLQVFFAIWWAWMNFTWFASSFDTDDVPFRLLTLVQMAGVLVLAAGVPAALDHGDYRAVTIGYLIMRARPRRAVAAGRDRGPGEPSDRAALRDGDHDRRGRRGCCRLAARRGRPAVRRRAAGGLRRRSSRFELAIPLWAERKRADELASPPHRRALRAVRDHPARRGRVRRVDGRANERSPPAASALPLVTIGAAALVLVFALWWLYFLHPAGDGLVAHRDRSYVWGYGHYGIFAALAALGAGLEVAVEQTGHHVAASPVAVGYAIAIPVAVFLVLVWALHAPYLPGAQARDGRCRRRR